MFEKTRELMDRYEELINASIDYWNKDERDFMYNSSIYFAMAMYEDFPYIDSIAKHLVIMEEDNNRGVITNDKCTRSL